MKNNMLPLDTNLTPIVKHNSNNKKSLKWKTLLHNQIFFNQIQIKVRGTIIRNMSAPEIVMATIATAIILQYQQVAMDIGMVMVADALDLEQACR